MKFYQQQSLSPSHEAILEMIGQDANVLEIGCATGHVTRALRDRLGCRVTAVEIDAQQAAVAEPYAERMLIADIGEPETWRTIGGAYDFAVFADVLEHLADPWQTLEMCRSALAANGFVLASIPNVAYYRVRRDLLFGRFDYTDYGILDDTHLRFFTARTARSMFVDAGYAVTDFIPIYRRRALSLFDRPLGYPFAFQFVIRAVPL